MIPMHGGDKDSHDKDRDEDDFDLDSDKIKLKEKVKEEKSKGDRKGKSKEDDEGDGDHPLATDTQVLECRLLDQLRELDKAATLEDLILERTIGATSVCDSLRETARGAADLSLIKSILATAWLHRNGLVNLIQESGTEDLEENEKEILKVAMAVYGDEPKDALVKAYRLSGYEVRALEAYSDANKSKVTLHDGSRNMFYMGTDTGLWGPIYKNGWRALVGAMQKIPTLRQLGIRLTTYRTPREPQMLGELSELQIFKKIPVESQIKHGVHLMGMGQRHFMSTAITYNVHWTRAAKVGGIIAVTGGSGVLINPFGKQGWMDGGEVLYPPQFVSVFEGMNPTGYREKGVRYPVAHLREVLYLETRQGTYEDSQYVVVAPKHVGLDGAKMRLIAQLEAGYDPERVVAALKHFGLQDKGVMYLTYDELRNVVHRLGPPS
ncbi:hypothetical protein [Rhizohabitans arisaemae]|uniref:hypothetical protein n=1 Tax=Rhizohabitans arisaemae TaxID=2720610 RepID=UPI0024B1A0BA|nr:hypothetical protein [Rhizohabitans arisaemae]